jgi:hypothetical protein
MSTLHKIEYIFENIGILFVNPYQWKEFLTTNLVCMWYCPQLWHYLNHMRRIGTILQNKQSSRSEQWTVCMSGLFVVRGCQYFFLSPSNFSRLIDTEIRLQLIAGSRRPVRHNGEVLRVSGALRTWTLTCNTPVLFLSRAGYSSSVLRTLTGEWPDTDRILLPRGREGPKRWV